MAKSRRRPGSRKIRRSLLLAFLAVLVALWWMFLGPATRKGAHGDYLYIRTGSGFDAVKDSLLRGGFLRGTVRFDAISRLLDYGPSVRPGRYKISRGTSIFTLVRKLRGGRQEPVKLVIQKLRTKADFVRLVSARLEADSASVAALLADSAYLASFDLDTAGALAAVIPDTYEFYWNTTADKAFRKIEKARSAFWTATRKSKLKSLGLTQAQATSLAAIVDEETNKGDEKGTIASVYLNRLRTGMKLQADPTARWAGGDFTIKRVTSAQTGLAHPYNTYYTTGLPPGPICTPSRGTLNAVLSAPATDFLYFCASEDFSGHHRFAATYAGHLKNARLYQEALNARGIH